MPSQNLVILWLLIVAFFSSSVLAEQTRFRRTEHKNSIQYQYAWKNAEDESQTLAFSVNRRVANNQFRHFKALSPTRMSKYVKKNLLKTISKLNRKKGTVELTPQMNGIGYKVTGTDKEWVDATLETLETQSHQSITDFLEKEYYIEFSMFGHVVEPKPLGYKPDHKRFMLESRESLQPIVEKLEEKFPNANPKIVAAFLLSWIQSIPYDTIESRAINNGAGFLPPLRLIDTNRGDCDSKVTLMAAILKQMYPNMRLAIIYVPQHALIGMNISHLKDDYILDVEGLDFTLSEPVGPALIEFAKISDQSKRYIESDYYQVELLY